MIRSAVYLLCGMVFGAGLALSGMVDPAKVQGFLDLFGRWDPSLAATMAGALGVTALLYRLGRRPLLGGERTIPSSGRIDSALIAGSTMFGLGWGLAGLCPAPAMAVWVLNPVALWFVGGMILGIQLHRFLPLLGRSSVSFNSKGLVK